MGRLMKSAENASENNEVKISNLSVAFQNSSISFAKFIEERLEELGITKNFLCRAIKIDNKSLNRILTGEAQKVDIVTILKLGDFLQIDFSEFVHRYIAELDSQEIKKIKGARSAGVIIRNFDLDTLKSIGFIKSKSNFEEIEKRILDYFEMESLLEYEQKMITLSSLFSRTRASTSEKMLKFWCMTSIEEFKSIDNPYHFDLEKVKAISTRLSISTSDEVNGLLNAIRNLYHAGVTVLVNPYLSKTQVRGATFIVNNKPCIVIQDFRKSYDTIWFALLHEICHVIKDLQSIRLTKYHITAEKSSADLFIDKTIEDRADAWAAEMLLPENKMKYIAGYIDIPGIVTKHARAWQVSESIIYGQYAYRYDKPFYYSKTKKAEVAIKQLLNKDIFKEENIEKAVNKVKYIYN